MVLHSDRLLALLANFRLGWKGAYSIGKYLNGAPLRKAPCLTSKHQIRLEGQGAYPRGKLKQAPCLTGKHQTRLERPIKDKSSSSLGTFINYGRKKFYKIGPRPDLSPEFFILEQGPISETIFCRILRSCKISWNVCHPKKIPRNYNIESCCPNLM